MLEVLEVPIADPVLDLLEEVERLVILVLEELEVDM
jgi:hypothetical protein